MQVARDTDSEIGKRQGQLNFHYFMLFVLQNRFATLW